MSLAIYTRFSLCNALLFGSWKGRLSSGISAPFTSPVTMTSKAVSRTASHEPFSSRTTGRAESSFS